MWLSLPRQISIAAVAVQSALGVLLSIFHYFASVEAVSRPLLQILSASTLLLYIVQILLKMSMVCISASASVSNVDVFGNVTVAN